jgi:Ala-tRNA(Pro) deacylase|uniref:YbaK/EbsC family protein n=1 Tax=Ignavibacterium album TaxID=591197 RepID=A0A7V2ZHA0_9BACT
MPSARLRSYLDENNIKYITIKHSPAFTAQEIAAVSHVPGKNLAKVVMINVKGKLVMAVLPASYKVNVDELKEQLGTDSVKLAHEKEFMNIFPDCEVGAMPPFGNLYGMDVYVAKSLAEDEYIYFNSCTHTELIQMKYEDFQRLVQPKVLEFAHPAKV